MMRSKSSHQGNISRVSSYHLPKDPFKAGTVRLSRQKTQELVECFAEKNEETENETKLQEIKAYT